MPIYYQWTSSFSLFPTEFLLILLIISLTCKFGNKWNNLIVLIVRRDMLAIKKDFTLNDLKSLVTKYLAFIHPSQTLSHRFFLIISNCNECKRGCVTCNNILIFFSHSFTVYLRRSKYGKDKLEISFDGLFVLRIISSRSLPFLVFFGF